jgi:hypothetical protein
MAEALPAMDERDPAASLPPSIASHLAAVWVDGDAGQGWDGFVVRYELTAPIAEGEMASAIAIAEAGMAPLGDAEVIRELARLKALTAGRSGDDDDLTFLLAVYAEELRQYPGAVVRQVLRDWPRANRFWPSLAELVEPIARAAAPREALAAALRQGYRPPEVSPDWLPPTAEEKSIVNGLLQAEGIAGAAAQREHPLEVEPFTAADRRRVFEETRHFLLPTKDDPRVLARLRELGIEEAAD